MAAALDGEQAVAGEVKAMALAQGDGPPTLAAQRGSVRSAYDSEPWESCHSGDKQRLTLCQFRAQSRSARPGKKFRATRFQWGFVDNRIYIFEVRPSRSLAKDPKRLTAESRMQVPKILRCWWI